MRGNLRLRVYGADVRGVRSVVFRRGRRVLARDRRAPFVKTVRRARLRVGRVNRIRALATMRDGRRVRLARAVRVCGRRR